MHGHSTQYLLLRIYPATLNFPVPAGCLTFEYMRCLLILIACSIIFFSCTKDRLLSSSDAPLRFTIDTLHFDTVFTTAGSVTKSFRIINENDQRIRISAIQLAGGTDGVFRINVNGLPGPALSSFDIDAGDSAHVFVNLQIPEDNQTIPFIVEDSISIKWNGQERWIQLDAYGQNAHYIRNGEITTNTTWTNTLPYVLIGPLVIETTARLTIQKGTRIYAHADAPILVLGSLVAVGDTAAADRIEFRSDRLDDPYSDFPASWPGLYFANSSNGNQLAYTNILNAYQGILAEGRESSGSYKIQLNQVIINNAFDAGILALNSSILANNLLISNCGKNLQIAGGGKYLFNHATIVAYSNALIIHKDPVVMISNSVSVNGSQLEAPLDVHFRNSIFFGESGIIENEVVASREGNQPYSVIFETGLWKMDQPFQHIEAIDMEITTDPQFESVRMEGEVNNFRLKEGSPAINRGKPSALTIDLDGKTRPVGQPDLGAYEKQ